MNTVVIKRVLLGVTLVIVGLLVFGAITKSTDPVIGGILGTLIVGLFVTLAIYGGVKVYLWIFRKEVKFYHREVNKAINEADAEDFIKKQKVASMTNIENLANEFSKSDNDLTSGSGLANEFSKSGNDFTSESDDDIEINKCEGCGKTYELTNTYNEALEESLCLNCTKKVTLSE